ncbi:hypothetical protein JD844_016295 [Phrynosoma platyrhinos]|uniref:Metalloendopeptidase n=1 Tax=Phrynosoma platyrhinos TaxID=52577 RepID=A0ABQ7SKE7_PHRPL|nr:hypothetical protein JD844_016295 [Phrynosoma platyrhinos]
MDLWLVSVLLSGILKIACSLPIQVSLEIDEDDETDQDIFDINEALGLNLFEGDIRLDNGGPERNSIIGNQYRWPHTIPYVLEDSLDMNAKGLILKAFERYRLKTCIDFKPWEGEANYISVFKGSGCWSYVGKGQRGRQELSIGANCDRIATIEHEFLHALGFWHEQSRSDRDDYVTIMLDRIQAGKESNFNKYDDKRSDFLNIPYDYNSVMHYSKTAFMNGTEPTIVTNIPAFIDVIGQRIDFSEYDIQKLSRLYNCSSSLSFMDTCSFELPNVCGMIQNTNDNADWQRITQVSSGPQTDHTYTGACQETGYFLHFNTSTGNQGDRAVLESRFLYPKRGFQCLQFFYYNSGSEMDQLNIAVKEYTVANPNDISQRMSNLRSITTDPNEVEFSGLYFWDRPDKVGTEATFPNGTKFMRGPRSGTNAFLTHQRLKSRDFIKDDSIFILATVDDISHLLSTEPNLTATSAPTTNQVATTSTSMVDVCIDYGCQNNGICIIVEGKPICRCPAKVDWWYMGEKCEKKGTRQDIAVIAVASSLSVFGVMLIITIVTTCCLKKKYQKQMQANRSLELQNATPF